MKQYLWNILVALDRFVNAATGGSPEMTLSGRFGLAVAMGRCTFCQAVCWGLNLIDPGHCARYAVKEKDETGDEVIKL